MPGRQSTFCHAVLQRSRRSSRRRGRARTARDVPRCLPASTEPPFITAERGARASAARARATSFNGAAVHHGGEVTLATASTSRLTASTEPPFITAERFWTSGRGSATSRASTEPPFITAERGAMQMTGCTPTKGLQRSRRSSRRRGRSRRSNGGHLRCASTEPPFITAEREGESTRAHNHFSGLQRSRRSSRRRGWSRGPAPRVRAPASTEPPFITAERSIVKDRVAIIESWLQRSRRSSRRRGIDARAPDDGARTRFNGAAVHHGGEAPEAVLQDVLPRGFNGAAVHHGGEGPRRRRQSPC